jgi:hypothetical protein
MELLLTMVKFNCPFSSKTIGWTGGLRAGANGAGERGEGGVDGMRMCVRPRPRVSNRGW